ncbi:hypothetical protein MMC09_000904, partial [Bachmanniomyces sp. S44760]|nr:hypothetical protein [Bachmanniomyces sp. S44760]
NPELRKEVNKFNSETNYKYAPKKERQESRVQSEERSEKEKSEPIKEPNQEFKEFSENSMGKCAVESDNNPFSRDAVSGLKSEMHNDDDNEELEDDQFKETVAPITPEKKTKLKKSSAKPEILKK